ncbi:MAG: YdcF family protein [Lachnospiraceae bacterium]
MKRMTKILLIIIGVVVLLGAALILAAMIAIHLGAKGHVVSDKTPVIVLGCQVKDGRPSLILGNRIDVAYEYLISHPEAIAVLSGGQGADEAISEAECMYRELTERGIDGSRLYKEESFVNTPTNLRHSKEILDELLCTDILWEEKHEIALITSEFHCYRSCFHAKQEGLNPVAFASKTAMPYVIPFYLREIVAVIYTWFFR